MLYNLYLLTKLSPKYLIEISEELKRQTSRLHLYLTRRAIHEEQKIIY